jgi:hypothetical protein
MRRVKLRIKLLAGIGLFAAALLAVSQSAYAATAHRPPAVPKATGLANHLAAIHTGAAKPDSTSTEGAYPRLNLAGCSRQDGFNGTVTWSTVPGSYVEVAGNVWDVCGTAVQVWVSWYSPTYHNEVFGSTTAYGNTDFDTLAFTTLNPGRIKVTVCGWWRSKWTCGQPYGV